MEQSMSSEISKETKSDSYFEVMETNKAIPTASPDHEPFVSIPPRPVTELDAAATMLQKVYRSYQTRKNLADCADVIEELWRRTLEDAAATRIQKMYRSYRTRKDLADCADLIEENWGKLLDAAALKMSSQSFL